MRKTIPALIFIAAALLFIAACADQATPKQPGTTGPSPYSPPEGGLPSTGSTGNLTTAPVEGATQELKKFSSRQEIIDFIESSRSHNSYSGYYGGYRGAVMETGMMDNAVAGGAAAPSASKSYTPQQATDYSQTNVQVAGVDEADFVKNDDKYIYVISGSKLVIVDAFPADEAQVLSETDIKGTPTEMFVNKDRLVVFTNNYDYVDVFSEYDYMPRPIYKQKTHAIVYDISDRKDPKKVKDYDLKGYYITSRMIGSYVYMIVQDNVYYYNRVIDLPVVMESSKSVVSPDIYYFDNPETDYNFNTVMSFNILDESKAPEAKTFMMGYANNIYVSEDNIYITYQKNLPYRYYEYDNEQKFYDVVVPLLPSSARSEISGIQADSKLNSYSKWDRISVVMEDLYNSMDESDKEALIESIQKGISEYEIRLEEERRKTVIQKIGIDNGKIDYKARGEVKGYLLNQFSMDEYQGNFRVATTMESYASGDYVLYNNVYVLDAGLKMAGKLENIAPDERIYSTRFMGDRLYMVTFMRIDPLFVIDMSDPKKPEVLGELSIPGFSDYLHPYDSTHIIGIGKETGENEWGGVSTKGLKLALFDVTDVKNPKQVSKYEIGDQGTDSEALNEHKAFLFDKGKNLLVIPVRVVKNSRVYDTTYGYYRQRVWQGAYVFQLDLADGFTLKGKVTHKEADEPEWYYYGSPSSVRRSLFMDDVLYTVSQEKIKANSLDKISDEIKEIDLPYETNGYPYPMYADAGMVK